ncbi:SlyX family protein [Undibacterium sp.]|uniref:SlyX family protein n=1 Tax=Undibacterium sp. TaxID=1914977 RepID=UPI00374CB4D7
MNHNEEQSEERLVNMEIKISQQEDLLDSLNQTVYRQQKKLDELEALCTALAGRIKDMAAIAAGSSGQRPPDERPPHY